MATPARPNQSPSPKPGAAPRQGVVLTALVDALPDGAILVDEAGRVVAVNEAAARFCGLPPGQMLGQTLEALAGRARWLPPVLGPALAEGARQSFIQEVDGRRLVVTASPLAGPDGRLVSVLGILRDITELDRLQRTVERLSQAQERYRDELQGLRGSRAEREEVVSASKVMQQVLDLAGRVARVDSTVLLLGESGVGKSMIARTVHRLSPRSAGPFVQLDCAAIPESLLESELFGYESGAFTGARKTGKAGIVEQADGGTLFLDEIAEVPLTLQVKLLQVIQERQFTRVGGVKPTEVNVRIIAATNRDLRRMVDQQLFRADLFYRLNVVPMTIPPLRERREDIPALVRYFLERFKAKYGVEKNFSAGVVETLLEYPWPGNVRELENMVERLVVTTEGAQVRVQDLPGVLVGGRPVGAARVQVSGIIPLQDAVEEVERQLLAAAQRLYGSTTRVGQALGIDQSTVVRKLQKYSKARPGGTAPGHPRG